MHTGQIIVVATYAIVLELCEFLLQESHDNRGQKLATEAGAYEARMFCDMLLKGAVNIVEVSVSVTILCSLLQTTL